MPNPEVREPRGGAAQPVEGITLAKLSDQIGQGREMPMDKEEVQKVQSQLAEKAKIAHDAGQHEQEMAAKQVEAEMAKQLELLELEDRALSGEKPAEEPKPQGPVEVAKLDQ